jgi:hypothetical protein
MFKNCALFKKGLMRKSKGDADKAKFQATFIGFEGRSKLLIIFLEFI